MTRDDLDLIVQSDGSNRSALGLVDQRNDSVDLQFSYNVEDNSAKSQRRQKSNNRVISKRLDVSLAQNITALRSRAGDTGGGVWRGSILLAQVLLQQLHVTDPSGCLFNKEVLSTANVLELGSGTGLLSLILAPFTHHYTCTDLPDLVPLIRKNISINSKLLVDCPNRLSYDALDWNDVQNCPPATRERLFLKNHFNNNASQMDRNQENSPGYDLILVVDCVYNPSLIPPLLTTIDLYTTPERSTVLVVMELRDEDVVREFLTQWGQMAGWKLWSIGDKSGTSLLDPRFAIWVAFKGTSSIV